MSDDYSADASNAGSVSVGGTATGEIETGKDFDWFAVEFVAGRTYVIDLEGAGTGGGSLRNTVLRGLYDADGNRIRGTRDDNSGTGKNAQLIFTATESGTYYIEARGKREQTGDYTVRVTDATPDLGDITGLAAAESQSLSFDGTAAAVAYRRFTLTETKVVELELLGLDADADLVLEDAQGTELHASRQGGTADESLTATLTAGTYYVRMEAQAAGANEFTLRYGLSTPVPNRAPTFPEESYAFDLAENADGDTVPLALGLIQATDPEDEPITYSIEEGNEAGLFEIDAATGALTYRGAGEDYESGPTSYELTVRASDGSLHDDVTVTVNVTDAPEPTDDHAAATDLGDITDLALPQFPRGTLDAAADAVAWYRFELTGAKKVGLGLRELSADADLILEDAEGNVVHRSSRAGTADEWLSVTLLAGTYYVRLEAQEAGSGGYMFRYGVGEADAAEIARLEAALNGVPRGDDIDTTDDRAAATDLGDITDLALPQFPEGTLDAAADAVAWYRFELTGAKKVGLGLRELSADADLILEDAEGNVVHRSSRAGTADEWLSVTLLAGTYYVRLEAQEAGSGGYMFRYGVDEADAAEIARLEAALNGVTLLGTPVKILDYSDPRWTGHDFHYGAGWSGQGFGLTGSQRGAPEEIEIAEVDGVTALRFKSAERDQSWYNEHPGAVGHQVHGHADSEVQDDFIMPGPVWTTGDNPYLIAQIHLGGSENFTSLRMPAIYETKSGDEVRTFPAIIYSADQISLRGPGRADIAVNPSGHPNEGWVTLGMTVTNSGDIVYVGKFGIHSLAELFADPDFRYYNSEVSHSGKPYIPVTSGSDGMFSQVMPNGLPNSIAYVEFGTDLALGDITASGLLDHPAGTDTGATVAVDGSVSSEIEHPGDQDWFAVTLEAGKTYRIDLEGSDTEAGTLSDPYLRGVFDADGVRVSGTTNDDGGAGHNSRLPFTATEDATYYVAAGAYGNNTGTYTLSVTDITGTSTDDFTAGTETGGAVDVGGSVKGEIDFVGDRDWFAVILEAGKIYRFDLVEEPNIGVGTLSDYYLHGVFDADGVRIPDTSGYGWLFFTATEDATHYVAAGAFGSNTGTYSLSVTEVTDDFTAGTETGGAVDVGGSVKGEIDFVGDRDWFAVTLEANTTYRIDLEGSRTGAGTLDDPYLRGVHDVDGDLLSGTTNDDGGEGRNSQLEFTATAGGTYYVAAGAYDRTGTYTLSVEEVM